MRNDLTGYTGTSALVLLYRLETESHKIERTIRTLQHQPLQHHTTQVLEMKILQALTVKGFSLDEKTPESREWSHSFSGTHFDTLPVLVTVCIKLTYWHCLKATGHTLGDFFATDIGKYDRVDPNSPLEAPLCSHEILPPRDDRLQRDTGHPDTDPLMHRHTGPRIDPRIEMKNTSSTLRLGDRPLRTKPTIQKTFASGKH